MPIAEDGREYRLCPGCKEHIGLNADGEMYAHFCERRAEPPHIADLRERLKATEIRPAAFIMSKAAYDDMKAILEAPDSGVIKADEIPADHFLASGGAWINARQMGMSDSVAAHVLAFSQIQDQTSFEPTAPVWEVGVDNDAKPKCCYLTCNGVRLVGFRHSDGAMLELNITGTDMSFEALRALKEKISEIIYDKERQR